MSKPETWRTEPEIDAEHKASLMEQHSIRPDVEQGIYPFKNIKLSRAEIEWLLVMDEEKRGPVDWSDESQRRGLDLRGANLRGVDLHGLPLARLLGGLTQNEWDKANADQRRMASVHLEDANLSRTYLTGAHLAGATLSRAHLEGAMLQEADLRKADLSKAYLEGTDLSGAYLEETNFSGADLKGAYLSGANLKGAYLSAKLEEANLRWAHLEEACLFKAHLKKADLSLAHLNGADLSLAHLEEADLTSAYLERADLSEAHLEGTNLSGAHLAGAELRRASFDAKTCLEGVILGDTEHGFASLADVRWGGVDLTLVDWAQVKKLGDEEKARKRKRLNDYQAAVRANRQLATVLRDQGLNEQADHFAYRTQVLQREVLKLQGKYGVYCLWLFLDWLAGYGYKPRRAFCLYVVVNLISTLLYWYFSLAIMYNCHLVPIILNHWNSTQLGMTCGNPLSLSDTFNSLGDAFIESITAFHGRGVFPEQLRVGDPRAWIAAIEAIVGLFIEASFIASFIQRFFGR